MNCRATCLVSLRRVDFSNHFSYSQESSHRAAREPIGQHGALLIQNIDRTLRILTQLKALGVKIAIDDFGTGYSSLATLQRFPLDTIKIDRSYIRDITTHSKDSSLTKAIIGIGKESESHRCRAGRRDPGAGRIP